MTSKFIRLINRNGVNETSQKFDLGQLRMTPKIEILMEDGYFGTDTGQLREPMVNAKTIIEKCLHRHHNGDWGDLDSEDKNTNDLALKSGGRLVSAYNVDLFGFTGGGESHSGNSNTVMRFSVPKIWIVTEWDRNITTILDPREY